MAMTSLETKACKNDFLPAIVRIVENPEQLCCICDYTSWPPHCATSCQCPTPVGTIECQSRRRAKRAPGSHRLLIISLSSYRILCRHQAGSSQLVRLSIALKIVPTKIKLH